MVTVYDVAKYILDTQGAMSAMKLEDLVFYSQAMSLVWDDVPLFDDDFEAIGMGPLCRALFNAHNGGNPILHNSDFLNSYHADASHLTKEQIETIDAVLKALGDYAPYELTDRIQDEEPGNPWTRAYEKGSGSIITKKSMGKYYVKYW